MTYQATEMCTDERCAECGYAIPFRFPYLAGLAIDHHAAKTGHDHFHSTWAPIADAVQPSLFDAEGVA